MLHVLFTCENPYEFNVDTADLGICRDDLDQVISDFCDYLKCQINPDNWYGNDFSDCKTFDDYVGTFKIYMAVLYCLQSGDYSCTCYTEDREAKDANWEIFLPIAKYVPEIK